MHCFLLGSFWGRSNSKICICNVHHSLLVSCNLCGCSFGCLTRREGSVFCDFFLAWSVQSLLFLAWRTVVLNSLVHQSTLGSFKHLPRPGHHCRLHSVGVGECPGLARVKSRLILVCSWCWVWLEFSPIDFSVNLLAEPFRQSSFFFFLSTNEIRRLRI